MLTLKFSRKAHSDFVANDGARMKHGTGLGPKMGLSGSFALPVERGSCRAVTPSMFDLCFIRGSVSGIFRWFFATSRN
jgi:hypothetical protein